MASHKLVNGRRHSFLRVGSRMFWVLGPVVILSLSFFYLSQVSETTWASFQISGYDEEVQKLTKQTKELETAFFESGSLQNVEELVGEMGFEKVAEIHYIQATENVIVTK